MRLRFAVLAEQMLHALIEFRSRASIAFSGIYAKCTRVERRTLWQSMENISAGLSTPWLVVGGFNVIASADEQVGGSPVNVTNMEEFNFSTFNCGLSSVDFDGSSFTWTNDFV